MVFGNSLRDHWGPSTLAGQNFCLPTLCELWGILYLQLWSCLASLCEISLYVCLIQHSWKSQADKCAKFCLLTWSPPIQMPGPQLLAALVSLNSNVYIFISMRSPVSIWFPLSIPVATELPSGKKLGKFQCPVIWFFPLTGHCPVLPVVPCQNTVISCIFFIFPTKEG